ncbi:hypothetical protein CTEN210_14999 [Chaetoceros tenuissimus]|uniref:Leucine-rich repeat domain-containing protein n=1 Tax=Chaetoceros tenuissimus TaxID=426638 RepID=A0AAD3D670_9STRA|nr:hypothetical protein CTEN210_14999 [Chaetoceros tenuissimus]
MRVQTEDWQRFILGVRNYKGKKTLFWNGERLWDEENGGHLIYNWEERQTWQVIMVLPGVEVIPKCTFDKCSNVQKVIMADTVRRIEYHAFMYCDSLAYVRLSTNLEYIERWAFGFCTSLTSIFIPPSCTDIHDYVFYGCYKLIILSVSQTTQLGEYVIGANTALIRASSFPTDGRGNYTNHEDVNTWIKNRLQGDEFALHRACSSFNPLEEVIYNIISRQGVKAFKKPDSVGVTPSQYLSENPFAEIEEQKILKRYILDMMGEIVS